MYIVFIGSVIIFVAIYGFVKKKYILSNRRSIVDNKQEIQTFTGSIAVILNSFTFITGLLLIMMYFYPSDLIKYFILGHLLIVLFISLFVKPTKTVKD